MRRPLLRSSTSISAVRLHACTAAHRCASGLQIEAPTRTLAVPDTFAGQLRSMGVDRLSGDAELGRERLSIHQPASRHAGRRHVATQTVRDKISQLLELNVAERH